MKRVLLLLGLVLLGSGCGSKIKTVPVYPVKGQAFYENKPLEEGLLHLHPLGAGAVSHPIPRAQVQADGSFQVTTYQTGDGAPPGEYHVTFTWKKLAKEQRPEDRDDSPELLPAKFQDPAQAGFKIEVKPGTNELPPFQLKRT